MIDRCSVMGNSTPTSTYQVWEKKKTKQKRKRNPPNTRTSVVCSKVDTSPTLVQIHNQELLERKHPSDQQG
jgi:hypothetical protein